LVATDEKIDEAGQAARIVPRRERVRAMMREEILEAARKLVQEHGFEGLAMRALGREVGVTAPTLYDYFPSKEAVVKALFLQGIALLHEAFDKAEVTAAPGAERLQAMFNAYREFGVANPDLYQLMFGRIDPSFKPDDEAIERAGTIPQRAYRVVEDAMDLGEIRRADPGEVCNAIWVMAHGHVMLEINGFCDAKPQMGTGSEMYQRNFWMLYSGLEPRDDGSAIGPPPADFSELLQQNRVRRLGAEAEE
jgi:AcrR family transcriptional regulator